MNIVANPTPDGRVKWFKVGSAHRAQAATAARLLRRDQRRARRSSRCIVLFGLNARRRARPHRVRRARPGHPRRVRPLEPGIPVARRAHAARRPAPRGPARVLRRPLAPRRASRSSAPRCGPCSGSFTGLSIDDPDARASRGRARAWAARSSRPTHNSLLSDYYPPEVRADVFGFHRDRRSRSARSSARSSAGSSRTAFGWRVPFFVFVDPDRRVRDPRPAAARSRAAATSSARPAGAERSRHRHRRDPAVVRGVGAHPLAGRARCAASGTRCRSSRRRSSGSSSLTSLYYEQVFHLGDVAARLRRRDRRARAGRRRSCSASRSRRGSC